MLLSSPLGVRMSILKLFLLLLRCGSGCEFQVGSDRVRRRAKGDDGANKLGSGHMRCRREFRGELLGELGHKVAVCEPVNDALRLWHLFALDDAEEEVCNRRRLKVEHELLDEVWLGLDCAEMNGHRGQLR